MHGGPQLATSEGWPRGAGSKAVGGSGEQIGWRTRAQAPAVGPSSATAASRGPTPPGYSPVCGNPATSKVSSAEAHVQNGDTERREKTQGLQATSTTSPSS